MARSSSVVATQTEVATLQKGTEMRAVTTRNAASEVDKLRQAHEALSGKMAHDLRGLREQFDALPELYRPEMNRLQLDLQGARSEIALVRANMTKMRDEFGAGVEAMRTDIAAMREAVEGLPAGQGPLFEQIQERMTHGLVRLASQVSDSEGVMNDAILNLRGNLASFKGDAAAANMNLLEELKEEFHKLSGEVSMIRAETRAEVHSLYAVIERQFGDQELVIIGEGAGLQRRLDALEAFVKRPRWWQWRRLWRQRAARRQDQGMQGLIVEPGSDEVGTGDPAADQRKQAGERPVDGQTGGDEVVPHREDRVAL